MYLVHSEAHSLPIACNLLYTFHPIPRVHLLVCEWDTVAVSWKILSETNQTKQRNKAVQLDKDSSTDSEPATV